MSTINVLSNAKFFQLSRWMMANADTAKSKTAKDLADHVSQALGFTITATNVANACEATGISVLRQRAKRGSSLHDKDRVKRLARVVQKLYERLGETPDPDLKNLLRGKGESA